MITKTILTACTSNSMLYYTKTQIREYIMKSLFELGKESIENTICHLSKMIHHRDIGPVGWSYYYDYDDPYIYGNWPESEHELELMAKKLRNKINILAKEIWQKKFNDKKWSHQSEKLSKLSNIKQELEKIFELQHE